VHLFYIRKMSKKYRNQQIKFKPFFDVGNTFVHVVVSLFFGGLFFGILYVFAGGSEILKNWIGVIPVLIATLFLSNDLGAHYVRNMLYEMEIRLEPGRIKQIQKLINKVSKNNKYIVLGLIVAVIYGVLSSFLLSVNSAPFLKKITLISGFSVIGFLTGIAIWSNVIVYRIINEFLVHNEKVFMFSDPDYCAGSLFMGNSLIIFSSLAIFNGVLFSIFLISFTLKDSAHKYIMLIKYLWIFIPFLTGIMVLAATSIPIHRKLRQYKVNEESNLIDKLEGIRKSLDRRNLSVAKTEKLQKDYSFRLGMQEQLHKMKTWPYDMKANIKYLSFFATNSVASYITVGKGFFEKILKIFSL